MRIGMYVRVPVIQEEADFRYPRTFALAQITMIDDMAETVTVRIHDLNGCKNFYPNAFMQTVFPLASVIRARTPSKQTVITPLGRGEVLSALRSSPDDFFVYQISFKEKRYARFEEREIKCDFGAFDIDPAEMLSRYEFQNPSWFAARMIVSSTMHVLHNAVYGFCTLAGCRVFLMPHQVLTIVRCLQENPIRMMLADEVGLGKTIEACAVLKVLIERDPKLNVLLILPEQLVDQWRFELINKFTIDVSTLSRSTQNNRILIITTEQLVKDPLCVSMLQKRIFNIAIVDETHHLLKDAERYECVRLLSKKTENVLLLSATPIAERKAEYFNLLRLLDPAQYDPMAMERFDELVKKQHRIEQELFMIFEDINAFSDYAESIIDQLRGIAAELKDQKLALLVEDICLTGEDGGKAEVMGVVAYIAENYRLEKNIIRNRRELLHEKLAPRKLTKFPYKMASNLEAYHEENSIDQVIEWLASESDGTIEFVVNVVQPILSACFSSVWALFEQFNRLSQKGFVKVPDHVVAAATSWRTAANRELESADYFLEKHPEQIHGRLLHVMDYLEEYTDLLSDRPFKAVVFTGYTKTLEVFSKLLEKRLGSERFALFYRGAKPEQLERSVQSFQSDPTCRILLCDELGGEGRNFQQTDILIHLDTPWDANSLEQRIGRLDRLGRDLNKPVNSVVLYAQDSIEEQLINLWCNGLNLFERSLSGLEIVTGEIRSAIYTALAEDVSNGLRNSLQDIIALTQRMKSCVEEEQFCDMTALIYHPLSVSVQRMLDLYQGKEDQVFADAMLSWATQTGLNPRTFNDKDRSLVTQFSAQDFSVAASSNAYLVPPAWDSYAIRKREIARLDGKQKLLGTFNRACAIHREDLLFYAPGDAVFESVTRNALFCHKGRACAFELNDETVHYRGLVFIWNVTPDLSALYRSEVDPILLTRFRAFLPMEQIVTLWPEDEHSASVTSEEISSLLGQRYLIRKSKHLGRRGKSSKGDAELERFITDNPPPQWAAWVRSARKACFERARSIVEQKWDFETALEEVKRILYARQASDRYFGYDSSSTEKLKLEYNAILNALKKYRLELDSTVYLRVVKHESTGDC